MNGVTQFANYEKVSMIRRLGIVFSKVLAGLAAIWLLLEITSYFLPEKPLSQYRVQGLIVFFSLGLIVGLIWELVKLHRDYMGSVEECCKLKKHIEILQNEPVGLHSQDAAASLLEFLRTAYSQKKWEEVITLGRPLSRPLWLTGRYSLRLEIGRLIEGAAAFSGQASVQASALIDDLGWTSAALRMYEEAKSHLNHGLELALKAGELGLVCRAYRHLAGVYLKMGDKSNAQHFLEESIRALDKVLDSREREELSAGIAYQQARGFLSEGRYSEALTGLVKAQELFARLADKDRTLKVHGPIGQAYLGLGKLTQAKDTFRKGLELAQVSSRRDYELVNLIGLAEVAKTERNLSESRLWLTEASAIANFLGDTDRAIDLESEAKKFA
jgi:tetratricopeptide (TPR) repeat protein